MWRSPRSIRLILVTVAVSAVAAASASLAVVFAVDDETPTPATAAPDPSPSPAPTETTTPEVPTPPPSPTPLSEPRAIAPVPLESVSGTTGSDVGARVAADPVRVHTGDGDCLNVRPQAGLTFEAQPYSCVPEGTLLWLTGEPVDADGETWRYALGAGWVATQYVQEAEAPDIDLPGRYVTLWQMGVYRDPKAGDSTYGNDVHVARVDAVTGEVLARAAFQGYGGGLGSRNPEVSPSGEYIAFSRWDPNGFPSTVVGSVLDGTAMEVPGFTQGWSAADKVLLTVQDCDGYICMADLKVYDARTGGFSTLVTGYSGPLSAWLPDGEGVLLVDEDLTASIVTLDGDSTILGRLPAGASLWSAVPSPDGDTWFSPNDLQNVYLAEMDSLTVRSLPRAPQRELPGKCGGTWSIVTGWLDEDTVFYHERSSSNGQDGITLMDTGTGARDVFPFFNAQDIYTPAEGMLSFASWSYVDGGGVIGTAFVLDVASGDFLPLFAGSGAVWSS